VFINFLVMTRGGGSSRRWAEITDFIGGGAWFFDVSPGVDSVYVA
jgi:hypothetical protein